MAGRVGSGLQGKGDGLGKQVSKRRKKKYKSARERWDALKTRRKESRQPPAMN